MAFLLICLAVAFLIQLLILAETEKGFRILRKLSLAVMELPFVCAMVWYAVTKTSDFVFSWRDSILLLLFAALAAAAGWLAAWAVYKRRG